ncbi:MAG: leucine-rich repeat protein [Acholeplasmatales bacterium]|nr:leucine-rich repeat protein [Acholeplasmatales bacterium]
MIIINSSVTTIYGNVFKNCSSSLNLYYGGTIDNWLNMNLSSKEANTLYYISNLYVLDEKGTVEYKGNKYSSLLSSTDIVIPSSMTNIKNYVFVNVTHLSKVYYCNTYSYREASLSIGTSNTSLINATWYYFTNNGAEETTSGNWWYYDTDGTIIIEKVVE